MRWRFTGRATTRSVVDPADDPVFPDGLQPDADGLIAIGGDLSERVLREAYRRGIFPWFNAPPLMWFSPDPRTVLFPERFHVPERLARTLRQGRWEVRFDRDFEQVMIGCANVPRRHEQGTWIDRHFLAGYTRLHRRHLAHCVGVYEQGRLCGGLYGVSLGRIFFGESMFSLVPNASNRFRRRTCPARIMKNPIIKTLTFLFSCSKMCVLCYNK